MKNSVYSSVKHTCAHQITVLPMYLHRKIGYTLNADIYISISMCARVVPFFFRDNMLALVFSALSQQHPWQQRKTTGGCMLV